MQQGRELWAKLDELGIKFKNINRQILQLSRQENICDSSFEKQWERFEADSELDQLKKKTGLQK